MRETWCCVLEERLTSTRPRYLCVCPPAADRPAVASPPAPSVWSSPEADAPSSARPPPISVHPGRWLFGVVRWLVFRRWSSGSVVRSFFRSIVRSFDRSVVRSRRAIKPRRWRDGMDRRSIVRSFGRSKPRRAAGIARPSCPPACSRLAPRPPNAIAESETAARARTAGRRRGGAGAAPAARAARHAHQPRASPSKRWTAVTF